MSDNSVPKGVWIFHLVWASTAIIAVAAYLLRDSHERYGFLQTVILTLTLIGLTFYTLYTRRMQEAMVRQINVSILPVFKVEILREGDEDPSVEIPGAVTLKSWLILTNVGNGTALNIQIDSLMVNCMGHIGPHNHLPVRFERIYSLASVEQKWVNDIQPYDEQTAYVVGARRPDLLRLLTGRDAWEESDLKIRFTDILGNKYVQVIHLGRDGIRPDVVRQDDGQVKKTQIIYNRREW